MVLRPGQAVIATLAVPGLAHFLLGRPVRGAVALLMTVGMFALGYAVLGDRLWFFQAVPSDSGWLRLVPLGLLPEIINFGCTTVVGLLREAVSPEVLRHVQMPRPGEHWASMLTGFSGIVAALWAADAFWLASDRPGQRKLAPAFAAGLTWLLPGAGHVMLGQKSKGYVVGGAVLLTFALGMWFGGGHSVDRASFTLWWAGQAFCGVGTGLAALFTAPATASEYPELLDLGFILCTVAGLMNLMVMTDAYAVADGTAASLQPKGEEEMA